MIDKDQILPLKLMIKEFYNPVMLRTIVNMVLMDMAQMTVGMKPIEVQKVLSSERAQKALLDSLETNHRPRKHALIDAVLLEYGLALRKDETEFYHRYMGDSFDGQIDFVINLVRGYKYVQLHDLSRVSIN